MSRPVGQLERSLAALTIGVAASADNRRRALADSHTGEWVQQIRVPISGQASPTIWSTAQETFTWEMPFLWAPLQRRVPFDTPDFKPGIVFQSRGGLVIVHAHVLQWTITEEGWVIGATVEFAALAPGATDLVAWSASAHLAFQGFGTYAEGT